MNYKLISILILLGLVVLFILQNIAVVEVQFLFWSTQIARSLLIFLAMIIGVIIGWLLHSHFKNRRK